jgi:hypothetical protein
MLPEKAIFYPRRHLKRENVFNPFSNKAETESPHSFKNLRVVYLWRHIKQLNNFVKMCDKQRQACNFYKAFLLQHYSFYCALCTEKYTGKLYIITSTLMHSCLSTTFQVACIQNKSCRRCLCHIKGSAGTLYITFLSVYSLLLFSLKQFSKPDLSRRYCSHLSVC